MLGTRHLAIGLLALATGIGVAGSSQAANQLYQGSWVAESFGNDLFTGTGASAAFSVFAMPQGVLCNDAQPRCRFDETPVSKVGGDFEALGTVCTPISQFGAGVRPAKGGTATSKGDPLPDTPRYRNPLFFTASGEPGLTFCTATSTAGGGPATFTITTNDPLRGAVMKGKPLTGSGIAVTTTPGPGGAVSIPAAPVSPGFGGMRRTTAGEFAALFPYLYSYTYATLRNDAGFFAAGSGPGNFTITQFPAGEGTGYAEIKVSQGPNKFGGVMKLLGSLTTKVCYFRAGGCSLGGMDWRYEAIGAAAYTAGGVVTQGFVTTYQNTYYHTVLMGGFAVTASASRFPWTTGSVTLDATGRGPHKTIERRKGYDNRTVGGKGTIQLVSPVLTRWIQFEPTFETGGIAVMRLKLVPEPSKVMLLVAGLSVLAVAYRARRR